MKCDDIKSMLDDYLDGSLSDRDRALVKDHVRTCPECREELRFMKKFKKEISTMSPAQAPADFLDRLHERMEQEGRSGLVKTLFFPLKLKIPLEAAGLLLTAAVAVLVFNPFRTERSEYAALEKPDAGARIERDSAPAPGVKQGHRTAASRTAARKTAGKSSTGGTIIAYNQEPAEDATAPPLAGNAKDDQSLKKRKSAMAPADTMTLYLARNAREESEYSADESPAVDKDRAKKEMAFDEKKVASGKGMKSEQAERSMPAGIISSDDVQRAVISLDGRIIKKACDDASKPCRLIVVELPAENYGRFVSLIGRTWTVRKQLPGRPAAGAERVRINITIE